MIALFAALAAVAAPVGASSPAVTPTYDAVSEPKWLGVPGKAMMSNCINSYLTDKTFAGEAIVMECLVRADGKLGDCQVGETKKAQAAGVQDVAICASAGFRIGPIDKFGKPTAGRPMILPLAIVGDTSPAPTAPAGQPKP